MSQEITQKPRVTRIQRFQSFQTGEYWRSLVDHEDEYIVKGDLLLIESIRYADDTAHTVILRAHPRHYGNTWYQETVGDDGTKRRVYKGDLKEHRFLVQDFLSKFEWVDKEDAEQERRREIDDIQGRVRQIQEDLASSQNNRDKFLALAAAAEATEESDDEEVSTIKTQPIETAADSTSLVPTSLTSEMSLTSAIQSGITKEKIEQFKQLADREARVAKVQADWIMSMTKKISETLNEVMPYYREQAAAALARTEDVRAYVKGLNQGIESLELYIGEDVEINYIAAGKSAPEDVPLAIMQRKLAMDEELSVWADVGEHFDFTKQEIFREKLRESPALVNQIFPTERCIVSMASTKRWIDYGDAWVNNAKNQQNKNVFLLLRDGENLYQIYSPVESHLGSARLFPSNNEGLDKFRGIDGSTIQVQDVRYTDKLETYEKMALHYKRFLILLCGLDHRLNLFGSFYPGPKNFEFVKAEFQERYFRFIHDDDGEGMLPLEDRPSFAEWIADMNAYTRVGSRVLGNWHAAMDPDSAPGAYRARDGRGNPNRTADPVEDFGVAIPYSSGERKELFVDVPCKQYSYATSKDRFFNVKTKLNEAGRFSYLCLDAVNTEELKWYINDRNSRKDFLAYIQLFKAAVQLVEQERAKESGTRRALKQALLDGKVTEAHEADDIVDRTVIAWRASNSGAPLPDFDTISSKDKKALLNQMYLLAGNAQSRVQEIEKFAREKGYEPLRLVTSGSAKLTLYAAPTAEEQDSRLTEFIWVHRWVLATKKTSGYSIASESWAELPRKAASETVVYEWPLAASWIKEQGPFVSAPEKKRMFDIAESFEQHVADWVRGDSEWSARMNRTWSALREELSKGSVVSPSLVLPFGLYVTRGTVRFLAIGSTSAEYALLHHLYKDQQEKDWIEAMYPQIYRDKKSARERFAQNKNKPKLFLCSVSKNFSYDDSGLVGYQVDVHGIDITWNKGYNNIDEFLEKWIEERHEKTPAVWLPETIRNTPKYFSGLLNALNIEDHYQRESRER
jgi:hypothetical protein